MRRSLQVALAASLLASVLAAWWPADDDLARVAPASQRLTPARPAVPLAPALTSAPAAWPADAPGRGPRPTAPPPGPLAGPAEPSRPLRGLPARPANWPAPGPAALAAWQGQGTAGATLPPTSPRSAPGPAATAAAAPAVPDFPYAWIGQLDDGGAPQLLLASPQRSVAVRLGATLDGRWRLARSADGVLQAEWLATGHSSPVKGAPRATGPS